MPDFPHLNLKQKLDGRYQFTGRRIDKKIEPQTEANLADRAGHGARLTQKADKLAQDYIDFLREREEQGLPNVFDENTIPVFLKIDPKDLDIESLKGFGIEIVSEEDDGFIIGANTDNFRSLKEKVQSFLDQQGVSRNQAAKLWDIVDGDEWRVEYILSEELKQKYNTGISDEEQFTVDISVACYLKYPDRPVRWEAETDEAYALSKAKHQEKNRFQINKTEHRAQRLAETEEHYQQRLNRWRRNVQVAEVERDEIADTRQAYLTNFIVNIYGGELLSGFIDLKDSFGFSARLSGQALKDLIRGYAYIFEITEREQTDSEVRVDALDLPDTVEIIAPEANSPTVCVIDSGMQEGHRLIAPAVLNAYSKNYVPYENTTADGVAGGGHGTKVAGAVLFGNELPPNGQYQPPCFVVNARVLDNGCFLPTSIYPPQLMIEIADDYDGVRLFNMSVASRGPCRTTHMSAWAATIDKLIHDRKILFLLAAGNINSSTGRVDRPGVIEHLQSGRNYPDYLSEPAARISNPAQSMLALTVGSVCTAEFEDADRISFGKRDYASAFSRTGPGVWGCIKPDVVEYGGDFLREKRGFLVTKQSDISPTLVKTGHGGIGFDVGTSFAAPKVSHIIARLAKAFPNDSVLLYKALVVQSARLPEHVFHQPTPFALRTLGYGIPDPKRALENTPYRVTFVAEGAVAAQQANLYSITVPEELKRAGADYDILIEVTLTYTATPRRTRRRLRSYFGSWLTWEASRLQESFDMFSQRVLKDLDDDEGEDIDGELERKSIRWAISTSPTYGHISDFKRQDSATQKDWAVLKSNQLPSELSFAVVGHKGWDKDTTQELPFALAISFEAISKDVEIYQLIETANQVEVEEAIVIPINR